MNLHSPSWARDSWRARTAEQMPAYADGAAVRAVEARLAASAQVVSFADCAALRTAMAALASGHGFLLQGGDCAESFDDPVAEQVAGIAGLFDAMSARLGPRVNGPLIEVARIAGQFAKPRSVSAEERDGVRLPAYRGDIINGIAFDAGARVPDPQRMIRAHMQSVGTAASLSAVRGTDAPIFTSHEALLLPYEEALTRRDTDGRWWATSGHMLWLGERTRQLDGAHVEYLRGLENVVGIKTGPTMLPDELLRLIDRLDPANRPGKLVLIGRFGAKAIGTVLAPLMRASKTEGRNVAWVIDPMHGNTTLAGKRKVRRLPDILAEIDQYFAIAAAEGVHPGGIHLEMSALDVTECIGGRGPASVAELEKNWLTACDPRLNARQAMDLADHVAELME
nr:3-deoxy-7-phosphoheptulonate synthase [uncultured Sphingomonas sp.]